MLHSLLIFIHVIVSLALIISVLMQSSKGGGLAGTFGGSGVSGGVFGGRGAAPFLAKATTACAILFMLTSLSLNFVRSSSRTDSVLERTILEGGLGSEPVVSKEMPISIEDEQPTADVEISPDVFGTDSAETDETEKTDETE